MWMLPSQLFLVRLLSTSLVSIIQCFIVKACFFFFLKKVKVAVLLNLTDRAITFHLEALEELLCLFQLLEAAYIPCLMSPFLIHSKSCFCHHMYFSDSSPVPFSFNLYKNHMHCYPKSRSQEAKTLKKKYAFAARELRRYEESTPNVQHKRRAPIPSYLVPHTM